MPTRRSRKKGSAGDVPVTPVPGSEVDAAALLTGGGASVVQPIAAPVSLDQALAGPPATSGLPTSDAPTQAPLPSTAPVVSTVPDADAKLRRAKRSGEPVILTQRPAFRRLQVYAFDPSLSLSMEFVGLNRATIKIPWESRETTGQDLGLGPTGEYLEVIDVDPASRYCYEPVDLNSKYLLAQDGLAPAEGNPQFHQQMVYAVAMRTIDNFEHALGRRVIWSPHMGDDGQPVQPHDGYVRHLRIYPHALREANAYYSPAKKALLFGYFPAAVSDVRYHLPGGMVFTCLSQDVVAHESTHAILDGMHRTFLDATNPDMLAFHEAFADIVALFQHFSLPDVLRQQIAKTRGDLETNNLLAQLAQEFGSAIGMHGALRDAFGYKDDDGVWHRSKPDPRLLQTVVEPHARGSLLVSAVFDGFLAIYRSRTADLLRIATGGSGVLPQGELHPDLVKRLANEASKAAQHVLNMCLRALDYCPPVDMSFGDYLRALITADYDLIRDDDLGYRVAIVDAFRQHGIYPRGLRSLSDDSLRWRQPPDNPYFQECMSELLGAMRKTVYDAQYVKDRARIYALEMKACRMLQADMQGMGVELSRLLGLEPDEPDPEAGGDPQPVLNPGSYQIITVRPARRVGPDGQVLTDLVIGITRSARAPLDPDPKKANDPGNTFDFTGGCTLLVDLNDGTVRYCISKRLSYERLARQEAYLNGDLVGALRSLQATYFGATPGPNAREPFAFLHRMGA